MKSPIQRKVILASNSPRRRSLLKLIVPDFEQAPSREVDETYPSEMPTADIPKYISRKKAEAYRDLIISDSIIVSADTVVIVDNNILGKPKDREEAFEMLKKLSGREHRVITGVTILSDTKSESFSCMTTVHFDVMNDNEIRSYIDEYAPFDKAGAYGIQEWIGARGITGIDGCFYNVMGLPVNELFNRLSAFDAKLDKVILKLI